MRDELVGVDPDVATAYLAVESAWTQLMKVVETRGRRGLMLLDLPTNVLQTFVCQFEVAGKLREPVKMTLEALLKKRAAPDCPDGEHCGDDPVLDEAAMQHIRAQERATEAHLQRRGGA